jgi:hypothetical protein
MRKRPFLLFASFILAPALVVACGSVTRVPDDPDGGGGSGGEGGGDPTTGAAGNKPDSGKDAFDEYIDPGCPDAGPPIEDFQCDPYNQGNLDCAPGEGCFIYVEYPPDDETCGQEIYGSFCAIPGTGMQGDDCGGASQCAGGHVCVVTGSGTQCVKLCPLVGNDGCSAGLVCEPIDVEGFGGCL